MSKSKTNVVTVPPLIYVSFTDDGEVEYSAVKPDDIDKGTTRVAVYRLDHVAKVNHDVRLEQEQDGETSAGWSETETEDEDEDEGEYGDEDEKVNP